MCGDATYSPSIGAPADFNLWGERGTSEYLQPECVLGSYTRIVSATGSRHFRKPLGFALGLLCFCALRAMSVLEVLVISR